MDRAAVRRGVAHWSSLVGLENSGSEFFAFGWGGDKMENHGQHT